MHTSLPTPSPEHLRVGQSVHVNSRAIWLPAVVTSVARTRVGVAHHDDGPPTLTGVVPPWVVRPADNVRLQPVHLLSYGDEVITFDGVVCTVATRPWEGRAGWWFVTFADGRRAVLPAGAVLRLVDTTPQVTVNGQPIGLLLGRR